MSNTVRIKRRAAGGAAGAPSSLQNAELAYNEQDDILYYGKGTGGQGGSASQVLAIAGPGAYQARSATLDAISGVTQTGFIARTGNGTAAARYLVGPAAGLTITNGDGVNGNPTIALADDLAALEGLSTTGVIVRTGDGAATTRAITGPASGITVTNGDGVGGNIAIGLANDLAALEGLNTTGLIARTSDGAATTRTVKGNAGRVLVSNGDGISGDPTIDLATTGVAAGKYTKITVDGYGRATLGEQAILNDIAAPTADFDFNGKKLTGLADPVSPADAATKNYVDMTVQGLDPKASVKAATVANIASLSGTMTIDGVALSVGDRVLVKDQNTATQNGIFIVQAGTWVRAEDANSWDELVSAYVFAEQGTVNAEMGFICTVDQGGVLGSTAIVFQQFSGAGQVLAGAGMTKTGNTLDVGTANSGRIVVNADNIDLAMSGVIAGTYTKVQVDAYGRAVGGSNPTTLAGYGITDAQALDATLTALAGLVTAADKLIYATGADSFALTDFPAYGRSLAASASAAAARATLGLGTIATQDASNVAITGGSISNISLDGVTVDGGTF